jgi:hypothetical protein
MTDQKFKQEMMDRKLDLLLDIFSTPATSAELGAASPTRFACAFMRTGVAVWPRAAVW